MAAHACDYIYRVTVTVSGICVITMIRVLDNVIKFIIIMLCVVVGLMLYMLSGTLAMCVLIALVRLCY